jgi:hypothetical protein
MPTIIPINYENLIGGHQQAPAQASTNSGYVQMYTGCGSTTLGANVGSILNSQNGGSGASVATPASAATNLSSYSKFSPISAKSLSNISTGSDNSRTSSNASPNALLYQKLLELVSNSADLANQNELSTQMNTLLSNPNIKARLKQLHTQLLKDPNEYWPKLENILLDDSKLQKHQLPSKDQIKITQDLLDLKNFYSKEYLSSLNALSSLQMSASKLIGHNDYVNNSTSASAAAASTAAASASNFYPTKTQPRIINREIKK